MEFQITSNGFFKKYYWIYFYFWFNIFNNYYFFLLQCLKKGFVLSLLSASKWLLAYVITLIIFPRIKPYVKGVIDNEYVLDIVLGISIFVVIIFSLLINKGISRVVKYSGFGKLDTAFGFLFGSLKPI